MKFTHRINNLLASLSLLCFAQSASAAIIDIEYEQLAATQWTMAVALTNDQESDLVNEFTLFFTHGEFSDLLLLSSPPEWDSFVVQPDELLGAGFFDSFSFSGLPFGASISGFTLAFSYWGETSPGALAFEIYDADFNRLGSGMTNTIKHSVPESSALMLFLLSLVALGGIRKNRN